MRFSPALTNRVQALAAECYPRAGTNSQIFTDVRLTIDTLNESVTLSRGSTARTFGDQWLVFYLALALHRTSRTSPTPYLDADELGVLGRWSSKRRESIGKEVARHIRVLEDAGLGAALTHHGRTKQWRLAVSPGQIQFHPSRSRCEQWLRDQNFDYLGGIGSVPVDIAGWLGEMTHALIHLEQGHLPGALDHVEAAQRMVGDSVLLGAITELVELRVLARRGEYPEMGPNLHRCEARIGRALRIRAQLAQALMPAPGGEDKQIEALRQLALKLEGLPDVNGLAHTHNSLGVTLRRRGDLELAARSLRYAAALLIATLDLPTLQATLFNLGHTLHEAAENDAELAQALRVLLLDREIHRELGLGSDSAQAEIVAGLICLKLGKIGEAEHWLSRAERIAEQLESAYNNAGVTLLRARLEWAASRSDSDSSSSHVSRGLAAYAQAELLVQEAGFMGDDIRAEAERFKAGRRPPWLPSWTDPDAC